MRNTLPKGSPKRWREQQLALCRYAETKHNNLSFWGLDYPPLSAYQVRHSPSHRLFGHCVAMLTVLQLPYLADTLQSWLYGKAIERLEPEAMALGDSHGYETASSKRLMRQSVMVSDLLGMSASA